MKNGVWIKSNGFDILVDDNVNVSACENAYEIRKIIFQFCLNCVDQIMDIKIAFIM